MMEDVDGSHRGQNHPSLHHHRHHLNRNQLMGDHPDREGKEHQDQELLVRPFDLGHPFYPVFLVLPKIPRKVKFLVDIVNAIAFNAI